MDGKKCVPACPEGTFDELYISNYTTTRIKDNVTPKVGQTWNTQFEQNGSKMKSAVYRSRVQIVQRPVK